MKVIFSAVLLFSLLTIGTFAQTKKYEALTKEADSNIATPEKQE